MTYTIHYAGQTIEVADYDTAWVIPDTPRYVELKDTQGRFHCLALGPGIPMLVSENPGNQVWVG
ncbi:hypothetical protein [Leucobacter tenebrionis]|uniref:hypothetical protein n=1 Tax=Leucobacter tenebrionis TaxID=2873270 RepID=UPI001CA67169|nr:hypothetical protein [Leucobacter tenebrionis]QZY52721.1 hypothetical protein KVY00_04535 [Leucobacter tenebrionis]